MQNEGHPIVCDEVYGDPTPIRLSMVKKNYKLSKSEEEERPILNRLGLHASKVVLPLPGGKTITLEAPMAKDMRALLQQLAKVNAKKRK